MNDVQSSSTAVAPSVASPPRDRWWVVALIVAIAAGSYLAILLPIGWWKLIPLVSAAVFVFLMARHPDLRYYRFAWACFSGAIALAAPPTLRFFLKSNKTLAGFEFEGTHWVIVIGLLALATCCLYLDFQWRRARDRELHSPSRQIAFFLQPSVARFGAPGVFTILALSAVVLGVKKTQDVNVNGSGPVQIIQESPGARQTQGVSNAPQSAGVVQGDQKNEVHVHGVEPKEHARILAENFVLKGDIEKSHLQIAELQKALDMAKAKAESGDQQAVNALAFAGRRDLRPLQELLQRRVEKSYENAAASKDDFLDSARQLVAAASLSLDCEVAEFWANRILEFDRDDLLARFVLGDCAISHHTLNDALQHNLAMKLALELKIARRPEDSESMRNLSVVQRRIGSVLNARGDWIGAVRSYDEGLDLARQLSEIEPENILWKCDLGIGLLFFGNAHAGRRNFSGAKECFDEAIETFNRLATDFPENALEQCTLSLFISTDILNNKPEELGWIGDIHGKMISLVLDAETNHENIASVSRALENVLESVVGRAREASSSRWTNAVQVEALKNLGDLQAFRQDGVGALRSYREGLHIARDIMKGAPGDNLAKQTVWELLCRIGNSVAALRQGGIDEYEECLEIARVLSTRDPENTHWQRNLVVSFTNLASLARCQGNADQAIAYCEQALPIAERLAAKDQTNAQYRDDLFVIREMLEQPK